jgi:hypothetical protein
VIHLLAKGDLATRREAAWCINNLSLSGKREQVAYVLERGVLQPFCQLLGTDDPQILVVVLDGISNILKMASSNYDDLISITSQIEECNGLDKIEELQSHRNEEIYKLAFEIIDKYFSEEVRVLLIISFNCGPGSRPKPKPITHFFWGVKRLQRIKLLFHSKLE